MNNQRKTLRVRCPNDKSILPIYDQPGIEKAFITCPICGKRMPFKSFQIVDDTVSDIDDIPEGETEVVLSSDQYHRLGTLKDMSTDDIYKLKRGKNIIGRKSTDSSADIQLPCGESKRMSREHLVIQVDGNSVEGYVFYASLYKAKENATYIGDAKIEYGDSIILNDGDIIKLPDKTIVFNVPKLE